MSGGFSFGQPSSSGTPSSGLFGSAGGGTGGNLFKPAGQQGSSPSLFGSNTTTEQAKPPTAQSPSPSLFGQGTGSAPATTSQTGQTSIFNPTGGTGTTPSMFGSAGQGQNMFGSGNKAATTASSGGLFGSGANNATAAAPSTGGFSFGANSGAGSGATTPNANKTGSLFGSTTPAGLPGTGGAAASSQPKTSFFGGAGKSSSVSLGASTGTTPATGSTMNLFGQKQPSSAQSTSTTESAKTGLFGAQPTQPAPAPSGGFQFPAASTAGSSQGQTAGSSLFGAKPTTSATPTVNVTPPAPASSGGSAPGAAAPKPGGLFDNNAQPKGTGALFGGGASSTAQPPATTAAASPFTLGGSSQSSTAPSSTTATAPASLFATPASSSAPNTTAAPTFNLGQPASAAGSTTAPGPSFKPTAPGPEAAGLAAAATEAGKKDTALGASTTGPKPPPQSRLKNKSMDEIITRWANDLQKYQKEFQSQAQKVADWDAKLVKSSEQIQKLYGNTLEAERATAEVERQLTAVENDQSEIEYWLEHYEKQVDELLSSQAGAGGVPGEALQGPDADRERAFKTAERLNDRLTEMDKDLGSIIEEINDATKTLSNGAKTDDPLSQIVRVLNGHLSQLQQIDQGTAQLQKKVTEVQNASKHYGPGGVWPGKGNAAEDFYRSFTGRM